MGLTRDINIRKTVKMKDLAIFSRQFSTMVNAGVPLLNVRVNVSPETTADTIGLDGGSGTDHVGEAPPDDVQLGVEVVGDG